MRLGSTERNCRECPLSRENGVGIDVVGITEEGEMAVEQMKEKNSPTLWA